jgi:lactate dehydrogenase-like 2-hydroxyacid dehydrogenase
MALPDLLKAIRKPHSAGDRSNETGVTLSDAELAWLRRIHDEVRNQFVHFEPMGWSLEVSGVPAIGQLIARILREMLDMGWAFRHLEREARAALRADLETLSSTGWAPGPNDDQTTRDS